MGFCPRHTMLETTATCRECRFEYCDECLVFPFGADQAPMCIRCALAFSGVGSRRVARRRRETWSERRRKAAAPPAPTPAAATSRPADGGPVELPDWAMR